MLEVVLEVEVEVEVGKSPAGGSKRGGAVAETREAEAAEAAEVA